MGVWANRDGVLKGAGVPVQQLPQRDAGGQHMKNDTPKVRAMSELGPTTYTGGEVILPTDPGFVPPAGTRAEPDQPGDLMADEASASTNAAVTAAGDEAATADTTDAPAKPRARKTAGAKKTAGVAKKKK